MMQQRFVSTMSDVLLWHRDDVQDRLWWLAEEGLIRKDQDGLTEPELAWWFISLLASPAADGAPAAARKLGAYRCINRRALMAGGLARVAVLDTFFPTLRDMPLVDVLTRLIGDCVERQAVDVWSLAADWAPHEGFRITARFQDWTPLTMAFGEHSDASNRIIWRSKHRNPLKMTREVDGVAFAAALPHVIRSL